MARIGRVVAPGLPHHVTQRGNRRQAVFFDEKDYAVYRALLAEQCAAAGVAVWAYCLMPNHVHLILVPSDPSGLQRAVGEAHRRYTRYVNSREDWRGYLWQGGFASFPLGEPHPPAGAPPAPPRAPERLGGARAPPPARPLRRKKPGPKPKRRSTARAK